MLKFLAWGGCCAILRFWWCLFVFFFYVLVGWLVAAPAWCGRELFAVCV